MNSQQALVSRIKRLPEFIANQIAAGEVIERPASVVKELLENAFDAKATQITVELGFGGLNLIKVSDNGTGILPDDLVLAVAPHATSKINQLTDLYSIQSMGFRGEALASISSVSRLIIRSKAASEELAMMLQVVNQELTTSPCARSQGTTVEVHDIFFNAPVRKKFLKSERGEFQAIDSIVKRAAMSAPSVAISLIHNDKVQWQLNSATCEQSMRARMMKVLGKKFMDEATFIDVEHAGMRLYGWLGGEACQRSQNNGLWIYLNNRMIKDKLLNHAIKQAYAPVLHPGRHPVCLLYLTMDPALVDVNVHPTKHEVRFQQARFIHDFMVSQISTVLLGSSLQAEGEKDTGLKSSYLSATSASIYSKVGFQDQDNYQQAVNRINYSNKNAGLTKAVSEIKPFIEIDRQFSLMCVETEVYLADMPALKAYWYFNYLKQQALPWSGRPLLVPIHYKITEDASQDKESHFVLLKEVGIELGNMEGVELQVRSLPGLTPQLDIKTFLDRVFFMTKPSLVQLITVLAESYAENSEIISAVEHSMFLSYVRSAREELSQSKPFIKKLTTALCQDFLYE